MRLYPITDSRIHWLRSLNSETYISVQIEDAKLLYLSHSKYHHTSLIFKRLEPAVLERHNNAVSDKDAGAKAVQMQRAEP